MTDDHRLKGSPPDTRPEATVSRASTLKHTGAGTDAAQLGCYVTAMLGLTCLVAGGLWLKSGLSSFGHAAEEAEARHQVGQLSPEEIAMYPVVQARLRGAEVRGADGGFVSSHDDAGNVTSVTIGGQILDRLGGVGMALDLCARRGRTHAPRVLMFTVGRDGSITEATIEGPDRTIDPCVAGVLHQLGMPASTEAPFRVSYPMN